MWWSAVDKEHWPEDPDYRSGIEREFAGEWGDRRQELVLIGMGMDEAALSASLDACLLDDEEMALGREGWRHLPDPFPRWDRAADAA
jgi:hypothetical protein